MERTLVDADQSRAIPNPPPRRSACSSADAHRIVEGKRTSLIEHDDPATIGEVPSLDLVPLTARELRLRRLLIATSILTAFLVLVVAAVVFYWRLYLLGPSGSPFTRGPYLVSVTENAAELRWRGPVNDRVELRAIAPDGRTITGRGPRFEGLVPGTRYAWTASVDGTGRAAGSFQTPDRRDRSIRFSVFADYGDGSDDEAAVARTVAAARPAFLVAAGDNSYLTAADILLDRNIFRPFREALASAPAYIGLGDHDVAPPGDGAIRAAFDLPPGGRYVVRHGPVQLVVLGVQADAGDVTFTRDALNEGNPRRRFVVVHKPLKAGNPILPVLRRARVDAVFSGHLHLYERRTVEGVRTFTVGTGGTGAGDVEFTPPSADADITRDDFGHLQVDVSSNGVAFAFIDMRGRVLDRTTIR
jgi:Calcineurin-like phosphoesterase